MLSKSDEGHNTDKTSIIVEYENRLDINNFELKNISKTKSLLSKDNFIRIDTDHIFSTIDEFEHVTDLISKMKTTGDKELW